MEMHDVERELAHLGKKAKDGEITLEDMTGGTFTITNGGVFGSMMGTPIINPPQCAILGRHATKNRPVCVGNKIEARPIMYVALTYDHRIIDGREAVLFLKQIKETIEDPRRILLDI
jgi:2-oxoglutarate dehydrogenase E2 component (dihydrolipoamide succinyltransferase)